MDQKNLQDLSLFEDLTPEEFEELNGLTEPAGFEAGENVFEEDGPEDYLYVFTTGSVEVYKEIVSDRQQNLATMEAPTVVGEMGLLTESRAAATVTARTDLEGRAFPREVLLERLEDGDPAACKVAYQIGRTLARRMAHTDDAIAQVIAHIEEHENERDIDIFQDKLVQEWSF